MSTYTLKAEPCDSNDYHLFLYSSLLDDDEFIMNILPCVNATDAENGGINSGVVISDEDGTINGVISSGGGGESMVGATVASRTTPVAMIENGEGEGTGGVEDEAVLWETTEAPTTSEVVITTEAPTTTEAVTTTEAPAPEAVTTSSEQGKSEAGEEETEGANEQVKDKSDEEIIHEETTKESTFYTCHANPEALLSGELSPADTVATKYELIYDYELVTSGDVDAGVEQILSQLETTMTKDFAGKYGLVDCSAKLRRTLRTKRSAGGVVALDSDPVDQMLTGQSCTTFVEENATCTPVRGYMTVWSENGDMSAVLKSIESGMTSGRYQSGNVENVVYIGVPSEEQLQSDINGASRSQQMEDVDPGTSVFLPVGIGIATVVIACVAFFVARRRKNTDSWDDRNGPKPLKTRPLSQALETPPTIDLEDDIKLLPSQERMDMRPINIDLDTDPAGTDSEEDAPMKPIDDEDLQSVESSVFSQERDESVESGSAASGLAAMGAASTLAARMGSDSIA